MELKESLAPGRTAANRPGQSETRPLKIQKKSAAATTISIIIPAHNEEAYLGDTLAALQLQVYPAHEIIVVANGCTDRTADAARGLCDRLIVLPQKGLGAARNSGAR